MSSRLRPAIAGIMLVLVAFGTAAPVLGPLATAAGATGPTPAVATSLSVTSNPPRLPADGGSYPAIVVSLLDASKNPSLATSPVTVYLTSSEASVGTVPLSVVIPAGKGFVVANFTTTLNPGVTSVTASAAGFVTAATTVDTKVPSGFASLLKVAASPSSVLASGTGSLTVQVVDATGQPAKTSSAMNVSITSSQSSIAKPDQGFVIIPAGGDMATVNFTTGYQLGTAIVTASGSTLSTGQTTLQVVGPNPYTLTVSAEPNQVVEGAVGTVVIWIAGTVGHPVRAPYNIAVTLTSSNVTVADLAQQVVVIPSGQMSATASFTAGASTGSAAITASAQGLQSGFSNVNVYKATQKPAGLRLFFAPNPVLADSQTYNALTVGIVNATGFPDVATTSVTVNLTSATTSVGTVTGSVTIPKGQEFATAAFTSTYQVGTTIVTASAQNLVSSQVAASTYGPIPAAVEVAPVVAGIPADGGRYEAISLTLVDATGNPAVASGSIVVQLSSSAPSVVAVSPVVQFTAGQSSIVTTVQSGISPGVANITASSPGYLSSFALLTTVLPAPSDIGLYLGPATTINGTLGGNEMVTVQLQDVNGLPAKASQPTTITVTPSDTAVVKAPLVLTIAPGGDYATATIATSGAGTANLTASSPGLRSASAVLNVLSNPASVVISPAQIVPANETATVSLTATALGQGVANATVDWYTNLGSITPPSGNTSASGTAYAVVAPNPTAPGGATVTAVISSPLFGKMNATTTVVFTPVVVPPPPSLASRVAPYLIPIVVVIIVALGAVAFLFLRRRRRRSALEGGETPAEEQPYDELEEGPAPEEGTDDSAMLFRGGARWRAAGGPP